MSPAITPKPEGYYAVERGEVIARAPRPVGAVLDIGCGAGGSEQVLRAAGATSVTGVEIVPEAAAVAATRYERVITGAVEDALPELRGLAPFDTVMCLDVLEHLVDPWTVLRELATVAAPDATLLVSVPNARHWGLARDVVVHGTFGYREWGHRDVTHLRWFTRRDLAAMLDGSGWRVADVWHGALRPASGLLARATRGLSAEFLVHQWFAMARRSSQVTTLQ